MQSEDGSSNRISQPFSPVVEEPVERDEDVIGTPKKRIIISQPATPNKIALRRKMKNLQDKLRRRDKKITSLKELILQLKKKGASKNLTDILSDHFSGFPLEMLVHQHKNENSAPSGRKYSEIMKGFALTLYFHSPRAYKYVRGQFQKLNKVVLFSNV